MTKDDRPFHRGMIFETRNLNFPSKLASILITVKSKGIKLHYRRKSRIKKIFLSRYAWPKMIVQFTGGLKFSQACRALFMKLVRKFIIFLVVENVHGSKIIWAWPIEQWRQWQHCNVFRWHLDPRVWILVFDPSMSYINESNSSHTHYPWNISWATIKIYVIKIRLGDLANAKRIEIDR